MITSTLGSSIQDIHEYINNIPMYIGLPMYIGFKKYTNV